MTKEMELKYINNGESMSCNSCRKNTRGQVEIGYVTRVEAEEVKSCYEYECRRLKKNLYKIIQKNNFMRIAGMMERDRVPWRYRTRDKIKEEFYIEQIMYIFKNQY